jgi:hypothetical protein
MIPDIDLSNESAKDPATDTDKNRRAASDAPSKLPTPINIWPEDLQIKEEPDDSPSKPPTPVSIWPEDLQVEGEAESMQAPAKHPDPDVATDAAVDVKTPVSERPSSSHSKPQSTSPDLLLPSNNDMATSIFTARSRRTRAGKTRIASRAFEKLLLQRAKSSPATKGPSSIGSSEYKTATDSEADSMSLILGESDSVSTSDAGRSDVSDLELDSKNLKLAKNTRGTIMDLPDEILEKIAEYLKPGYQPKEEVYRNLRVVLWEQDDVFNPSWGKDIFGFATTCRRFRKLLYDCNRLHCIQVIDSEQGLESMVKNIPKKKKDFVK